MRVYSSIILFFISGLPLFAQPCELTFKGHVFDSETKEALAFAGISIKGKGIQVLSDEQGRFELNGLCAGTYTIVCTHLGCSPLEFEAIINNDLHRDILMPHTKINLEEVEIRGQKAEKQNTRSTDILRGEKLEKLSGLLLADQLKTIPGVSALKTGNSISKPVIHGMHGNRVLILNNGVRQEGQQWGVEHGPEIDPAMAGEITVIKGANSVRYGADAIAGVILVEPKRIPEEAGLNGEITLGAFSNGRQGNLSGSISGRTKKFPAFGWYLQGSAKRGGNIQSPQYYLKNTGMKEGNLSLGLNYEKEKYSIKIFGSRFITELGIFSASHIGNLTDLQRAFDAKEPLEKSGFTYEIGRPYQHIEHDLLKTQFQLNTGSLGSIHLTIAGQKDLRYEYDKDKPLNDSLASLNRPELLFNINTISSELIWEHHPIHLFSGEVGLNFMSQKNSYEGRFFIPFYDNSTIGFFAIERWRKNKLEFEGGLRYDLKNLNVFIYQDNALSAPTHHYANFSGTLGSIYHFNEELSLSFNSGTAFRPPSVNELYSNGLHHGSASIEVGDKNLIPEKALNSILTLSYHGAKTGLELGTYYNYIRDYIYLQPELPATLSIRGAFPTFYYRQTNALFKGVDLDLDQQLNKSITFHSKASLLWANNLSTGKYLPLIPANRFDQELKYQFADFHKIKEPTISFSWSYTARQNRVEPDADYVAPPPAYNLFNIDAGVHYVLAGKELNINLRVDNLLNTSYRDYLNRFRYYADDMGRMISLRVNVPFGTKK